MTAASVYAQIILICVETVTTFFLHLANLSSVEVMDKASRHFSKLTTKVNGRKPREMHNTKKNRITHFNWVKSILLIFLASLAVLFSSASPAEANTLRWDPGFNTWPDNQLQETLTNVDGSGLDIRITLQPQGNGLGSFGTANPGNSDFVLPSAPSPDQTNSLFIGLASNSSVIVDIEFFETGTTNRVQISDADYILHDVDVSTANPTSWRDVIETAGYVGGRVGPNLGGTPVLGIQDDTTDPSFGNQVRFNEVVSNVAGRITAQGVTGDSDRMQPDDRGNLRIGFTDPVDTISFIFRNDPTTQQNPHGISLGFIGFTPPQAPGIGISKELVNVGFEPTGAFGDNTARAEYEVIVRNTGNESLNNVQLTEDLTGVFGAGNFQVESLARTAGVDTVIVNPGFNGVTPNDQLAGGTLAIDAEATFRLIVDIDTASNSLPDQPFENQVAATGTGAISGQTADDLSNDVNSVPAGEDPITVGQNNNQNTPTPLTLPARPSAGIGISKELVAVRLEPGGGFGNDTVRADYEIVVRNTGGEPLEDVQLNEDLTGVFGAGNFQVFSLTGPTGANTLAVNPGFTGVDPNDDLLDAGGTLAVGAESAFRLVVDINAASDSLPDQPFENQVAATGTGANSGQAASDLSNDVGSVPAGQDPITVGQNNNQNTPTPLNFSLEPDVRLVKRITAVTRDGTPVAIDGIDAFNDQPGTLDDNQLQQLSNSTVPIGVFNIPAGNAEPGDSLEYTIYFWNNGLTEARNLEICDEVQAPGELNNASLLLAPASGFPTLEDFGQSADVSARAPGSPLAESCRSAPGNFPSGGGGVVGGDGFNLPARQVSAVRFLVEISSP